MKKAALFLSVACLLLISTSYANDASESPESTGPGSYQILNNAAFPIRIPFKMHFGKPLMELEINGKKATLMIDNGILWDQIWLFGSDLVNQLELKPVEDSSIGGAGEGDPTEAYTSSDLTLRFKDIVFYDQPVLVSPPAAGFAGMFPGADGQLCNTFFKHFIVEFDFIRNEVLLHKPDEFRYTRGGSVLDMKENESGTYSIPFSFTMWNGKSYTDRVDIDFGGIYALKIALNNKHQIRLPDSVQETFSYGAQGRASEYLGKIKNMAIGKYQFDNPVAVFGDEKTSRIHPDNLGVIGLPLFMRFDTIFDYPHNKLYLTPNKNIDKPFEE